MVSKKAINYYSKYKKMKKLFYFITCCMFSVSMLTSCSKSEGRTSITHSESEDVYKLVASYPTDKTDKVQRYMDTALEPGRGISFRNTEMDANLTLDNKMSFYIKSSPGELKIEMNKNNNSQENYLKMKEMGKGIKDALGEK